MALTATQVLGLAEAMKDPAVNPRVLARELGIGKSALYRYVSPTGELREAGRKVLLGSSP